MSIMSIDLGVSRVLGAEAVGRPGQRRFRLFIQSGRGSALIWMEKEQLNSLSLALDRALAQLTNGQVLRTEASASGLPAPQGIPTDFPSRPTRDIQAGQITVAYDERDEMFIMSVVTLETLLERTEAGEQVREDDEALSFRFTQVQAHELSINITTIVRAGRPVCPFCGTALDGGPHACVKQNGHHKTIQVQQSDLEDNEE
jgi:uncharacterized repeat protein (TIGR03847 family)